MRELLILVGSVCVLWPRDAAAQTAVPLCAGLTVVSAVSEPEGDYEGIMTVESVNRETIDLMYSNQVRTGASVRLVNVRRTVLARDIMTARLHNHWFNTRAERTQAGTTALRVSTAVFRGLKTSGQAEIGLIDRTNSALTAQRATHPNMFDYETVFLLRPVSRSVTQFPVVLNNAPARLPVIAAAGENTGDKVQFHILDDADNPLVLQMDYRGVGGTGAMSSRVVKISHSCTSNTPTFASLLEKALLETGRASVYQLYFDFNSDRIRTESDKTLSEIALILRRHPDWSLHVEGHTDNIGGANYNLTLSQKRAAAVKTALVTRFNIAPARLTTAGAGASSPVDRNDTVEGRARNRRVELVRR